MHPAAPSTILQRLHAITAGLPQSCEEAAWVGVRLTQDTDWDEIAGLVKASYRKLAPKPLAAVVG